MSLPAEVFETPLLRGLDDQARAALRAAGRMRTLSAGQPLYAEQEDADSVFVVLEGALELQTIRRGDDAPSAVRQAEVGHTVGEESCLGIARRATATATAPCRVAELPATLFVRGFGRSGASSVADRELRILIRSATEDLLRTLALTRDLSRTDLELVLDAVTHEPCERGQRIFGEGEAATEAFLVVDGLVQLQTEHDDAVQVQAYLTRGDMFGDAESLAAGVRTTTAVAIGTSRILRLPASTLRTLVDRNPALLDRIRRISGEREELQREVVGSTAAQTTRHVFQDLYRMQMARSLLVIDQDSCVRCGHCAWSCAATHEGVSRLVRRGDKVVTRLPVMGEAPKSLLVPNSCQHCRNPACMIDCPTGAIGRDPRGEVFIRPELCTGCGACAKACPWDNIQMAPRSGRSVAQARSETVAVKCDLCRDYEGPACVQACPTAAIVRLEPEADVADVARVLGRPAVQEPRRRAPDLRALVGSVGAALGVTTSVALARRHEQAAWTPGQGTAAVAGWVALLGLLAATAYALPKRRPRLWLRRRVRDRRAELAEHRKPARARPVRSRMRPLFSIHMLSGWLMVAAVAGHAGLRWVHDGTGVSGALGWCAALVGVLGLWGAVAYAVLPSRLTRIEREGALPEDLAAKKIELHDRLYREISGRSDLVKVLARRLLLPYAGRPLGWLTLALSGRSLASEQARLRGRVQELLQGRGEDKLAGLDDLLRTVVDIRALPLRRVLTVAMRAWLVPHIIATSVLWVLVLAHLVVVWGGP